MIVPFFEGEGGSASDYGPQTAGAASDTQPDTKFLRHISNNQSPFPLFCHILPALSAEHVAADIGGTDAGPRAVADLTPHHWVAAKRLGLTLGALRAQSPRRADTITGHGFT